MSRSPCLARASAAAALAALLTACAGPPQGSTPYAPTAAMTKVLAERVAMNAKEPYDVYFSDARDVPSLVEAEQAIPNVAGLPAPVIAIDQFTQPAAPGSPASLAASLYRPKLAKDTPIIIFFPGESWVARSEATADEIGRQLCERTGDVVLIVRPRLAPQAKFPAIHDDALAEFRWARSMMRSWGADPTRVVLAGEGPGANLALATAIAARDSAGTRSPVAMPDRLVLITPWVGTSTSTDSMSENSGSRPLSRATFRWSQRLYAPDNLDDPRMDPVRRANLTRLPPTTIVLAEIDPARSDAERLASELRAAGVRTDSRLYHGVTAEFFGLGALVPEASQAENDVAADLRRQFGPSVIAR